MTDRRSFQRQCIRGGLEYDVGTPVVSMPHTNGMVFPADQLARAVMHGDVRDLRQMVAQDIREVDGDLEHVRSER